MASIGGNTTRLDKVFVGGFPYYFIETQIKDLLDSFVPLHGFDFWLRI